MQPAIEVVGVRKAFGKVTALRGVDLRVPAGSVLGLLGPNGAGKTTLVRILATLLRPDGGSVQVAGHDVVRHPQRVRRAIGLAGQYASVDEHLTGRENLELVARLGHLPAKEARVRAAQLLMQVGLEEAADRAVKGYSGGMRRRLDLAAALVGDPQVVFLDEPTTGLDPPSRQALWGMIERLRSAGKTILLTTQYLEEADRLADHVAVVDQGRIIAAGSPQELKARLGGEVVEVTVEHAAQAAAIAKALRGRKAQVDRGRVRVPAPKGAQSLAEVLAALKGRLPPGAEVALRKPTLDDVFVQLTGHAAQQEREDREAAEAAGKVAP